MAYIGNTPAENYASFLTETFTVSATANYTLSHAVANENDIRLVINGVVQQPGSGKAYTASGTTLTLTSATVSGDVMYAVYLGRALQTVNAPNASVGSDQTAPTIITGQTAETSIATDDTILIHDTSASALRKMTRANFVSGIGGDNTPAFRAYLSSNQTINDATDTVVSLDTEDYDTDSAFNTSNYKFTVPSGEDGKYFFYAQVYFKELTNPAQLRLRIRKNTSTIIAENYIYSGGTGTAIFTEANDNLHFTVITSTTASLSASDVIDISVVQAPTKSNTGTLEGNTKGTFLHGYKLIGV